MAEGAEGIVRSKHDLHVRGNATGMPSNLYY